MLIMLCCSVKKNQIINIQSYQQLPKDKDFDTTIVDFLEKPMIAKLIWICIKYGAWLLIATFIVFIYLQNNLLILFSQTSSFIKGIQETKDVTYKDINIKDNLIFCLKSMIWRPDAEYIQQTNTKIGSVDKIIRLGIFSLLFMVLFFVYTTIKSIILEYVINEFRKRFFYEFVNKVKIDHFLMPYKNINYISLIFANNCNTIDLLLHLLAELYCIGALFKLCFQSYDKKWKIALLAWIFVQLIRYFLIFSLSKPSKDAQELSNMENGFISNIEMQKYLKVFDNTRQDHTNLLDKIFNNKVKQSLLKFLAHAGCDIVLTIILGYGLFFGVLKYGKIQLLFMTLPMLLESFYTLPHTIYTLFGNFLSYKEVMMPLECCLDTENYQVLKKDEIKQYLKTQNKQETEEDINLYLQEYYPDCQIFKSQKYCFIPKMQIQHIKLIEFIDLSFKYKDSQEPKALTKVNIKLQIDNKKPGLVLVCGRSGKGKSTLLKLLFNGLQTPVNPQIGMIKINNINRDRISNLLDHMFISIQTSLIIKSTLFKAIAGVISQTDIEQIEQYNKIHKVVQGSYFEYLVNQAFIQSGLNEMTPSLNFEVLDNGANLSGGMKALLNAARLYLQMQVEKILMKHNQKSFRRKIAVFDELFASLDAKRAETLLQDIISILIEHNATGIFVDHSKLLFRLINDTNYQNIFTISIIYVGKNRVLFGTIVDLLKDQEFLEYWEEQKNKKE